MLGSLVVSASSVCIACLLCWMVHGKYRVNEGFLKWINKYLGKVKIPLKKSVEEKMLESVLSKIRRRSFHKISLKSDSTRMANESISLTDTVASRVMQEANHNDEKQMENLLKDMNGIMKSIEEDIHYLVLEKVRQKFSTDEIAKEEWKALAVVLNRFSGIILSLINIGMLIYAGLVMLTPFNGF